MWHFVPGFLQLHPEGLFNFFVADTCCDFAFVLSSWLFRKWFAYTLLRIRKRTHLSVLFWGFLHSPVILIIQPSFPSSAAHRSLQKMHAAFPFSSQAALNYSFPVGLIWGAEVTCFGKRSMTFLFVRLEDVNRPGQILNLNFVIYRHHLESVWRVLHRLITPFHLRLVF